MNEQQENIIKHLLNVSSKLINCECMQETLLMYLIKQGFRVTKLQRSFRSFTGPSVISVTCPQLILPPVD